MTHPSAFSSDQWAVFALLFAGACGGGQRPMADASLAGAGAAAIAEVRAYGSLKATIEERKLDKVVSLSELRGDKTLVGFGLLSALRGEVVIVDGEAWVSYPKTDGTLRSEKAGTNDETLAFLVAASVPEWQSVPLAEDTKFGDLSDAVEALAKSSEVDAERPFAFVVDGALVNLRYSVVNGGAFAAETKLSWEALKAASPTVKVDSVQGTLVGFYSPDERPEFQEPGQRVHVHVVVSSRNEAGHVDSVDLPRGTNIRLPAPRRR